MLSALPWASLLAVAAWARWPHPGWLVAAAGCAVAALLLGAARGRRTAAGLILVLAAVAVGFWAEGRDSALARDFQGYWADRETQVFETLGQELSQVLDRATLAATTLAESAAGGNTPDRSEVVGIRRSSAMAAVAVYDGMGRLRTWDGVHRGPVPEEVQMGQVRYRYGERPLVSYFYVTVPVDGGGTAVAALLLRADLPTGSRGSRDFVSGIREHTGESIRITSADRAQSDDVFDYQWEGEVLFSVSLDRPGEAARRADYLAQARSWVVLLLAMGWLLTGLGAAGGPHRGWGAASVGLGLALLVPVTALPGLDRVGSPADVLLPGGLTLARLVLIVGACVVAAGALRASNLWNARAPGAVIALAAGFPLLVRIGSGGASSGFLAGAEAPWLVFTITLAGALGLVAWAALAAGRREGRRRVRVTLGVATTVLLSLGAAWWAVRRPGLPAWALSAWALPLWLLLPAGPRKGGRGAFLAWMLALLLGTSATLPWAWGSRIRARMAVAEVQLDRLGTSVDPYLQFLLERTAAAVDSLDAQGTVAVELLYEAWRQGGLADAGYPVWLTLWSPADFPSPELRIGFGSLPRPAVAASALDSARASGQAQVQRFELADAHYLLTVPLPGGRVVTGVVPPLRGAGGGASLLGPLFGSLSPAAAEPITLIPALASDSVQQRDSLRWVHLDGGWQGELALTYPGTLYHAHYRVALPGAMVTVARATLILALAALVFAVLWGVGRTLGDREGRWGVDARKALSSFRARVTLALFGFFALSNLIFGSLAYRTLAGASQRAARVLSERAVDDASGTYFEVQGEVHLLSRLVGSDLLEYRRGELLEGSVEELVELGLYEGWVPYDVYQGLSSRETLREVATTDLGTWEYVTAYRRLPDPDGDILAAPVPLIAGATAVRSREVAHLLGLAVLLGGALSLGLALLVGRALTRPIQTLRVASERVGSGNLRVRLPAGRADEFGAVFDAFNRMVRRLRGARRDLVRTTRRTQAIVDDAATGVLAFDAEGAVTLVNPRARELLHLPLTVGRRLPEAEGAGGEFVRWVELYFRDGLREAATELHSGERRIRARARRIGQDSPAGAVVSLEDVTDELRTERVLAWGEMARQVAHEVKNPLTPIKLSVQHIRRAWEDRRTDFDAILTRNADAMLREIDRLAAIATSFSRFGAPRAAGEQPLGPVRLPEIVAEVMALYSTGEGPIRFVADLPADLSPVAARGPEVKEVLVNLLENARAAIREGGTVLVQGFVEGDRVALRVVDDGTGIPEAMLSRVFEPHFSTRSTGTGLGLAIVQRLVDAWGASVTVESEEGEGTIATLRFRPWRETVADGDRGGPEHYDTRN